MSNSNIQTMNLNNTQLYQTPSITEQKDINIKSFEQCFYGCKLDKNTRTWSCKKFNSIKEANTYIDQNKKSNIATHLIPVNRLESLLPDYYKKYRLFNHINFPVEIDTQK